MEITGDIYYVGVNDYQIELFEEQYPTPNGMAYNSYVIMDEKIAVLDTVDTHFGAEWITKLKNILGENKPDYLIIHHMEPDHSANISRLLEIYPDTVLVASAPAFTMMKQFFGSDFIASQIIVKDNDILSLGKHTLTFFSAPMVHWPEVMVSYDKLSGALFSADAFGKFGTLDTVEDWACEARRYYFGIVGKYGAQVQTLLKKLAVLDIRSICPLHGPVLPENIEYYINLYHIWSSYEVESDGVFIAYASVYGNTQKAAEFLAEKLRENGCPKVVLANLSRDDMTECIEDAFRYGTLVLASTTYNGGIFPSMREFLNHLTERNYQNRIVAFIENGTWAPTAAKTMKSLLDNCRDITFLDHTVQIRSALNNDSRDQLTALAAQICVHAQNC